MRVYFTNANSAAVRFIVSIMAAVSLGAAPPVVTISPDRVLDLKSLVRAHTLRTDFQFRGIAESNGVWAALVQFQNTKTSMVIVESNGTSPRFSEYINALADRIAIEPSGQVYLRLSNYSQGTDVEIRDAELNLITRQKYRVNALEPIPSDSGTVWVQGESTRMFFRLAGGVMHRAGALASTGDVPIDATTPDVGLVMSLSNGSSPRWVRLRQVSEEISVFENDGTLLARNRMDLDTAYTAFGYDAPPRYPAVPNTRIAWALTSRRGEVLVCLSSVPIYRPQPVAVIDPFSGQLRQVLSMVLPRSPDRVNQYNPQGFMVAGRAAVDDRLVVLDSEVGLLAIYSY